MTERPLLIGAVAYAPKVTTIWEGIREYLRGQGIRMDFALFSNYERQVDELLRGHIDIAWNTPLAHVRVKRRSEGATISLGMRDTDRDFSAKVLVRKDAGIKSIQQLPGKTLAVGSRDSTQARILPLHFLKSEGVALDKVNVLPFDTDLGKHGDTGLSELDVLAALKDGRAQAGTVGDLVWVLAQGAGKIDPEQIEVLWTTPKFDHCMFDAAPSVSKQQRDAFMAAMFAMRWDDPAHRRILELEGLQKWVEPRESGYDSLIQALDETGAW